MKPILFSLLLLFAAMALRAEDYTLGPDSQPQDGVPKGTALRRMESSSAGQSR
jgi:hypothetical protein